MSCQENCVLISSNWNLCNFLSNFDRNVNCNTCFLSSSTQGNTDKCKIESLKNLSNYIQINVSKMSKVRRWYINVLLVLLQLKKTALGLLNPGPTDKSVLVSVYNSLCILHYTGAFLLTKCNRKLNDFMRRTTVIKFLDIVFFSKTWGSCALGFKQVSRCS